jgi:hypothetical protein
MGLIVTLLLIVAFICFCCVAIGKPARFDLISYLGAGCALCVLAYLIGHGVLHA